MRESIEELIEESYLLSLSETEIKDDLDRFVESCGRIIREHVSDRKLMQDLAKKLARARALSLIEDHRQAEGETIFTRDEPVKPSRERFAERVARNKRLILRTIGECNPGLVELIEKERFPGRPRTFPPALPLGAPQKKGKGLFLKVCYAVTLLFVLLLVYLVLLQQNF